MTITNIKYLPYSDNQFTGVKNIDIYQYCDDNIINSLNNSDKLIKLIPYYLNEIINENNRFKNIESSDIIINPIQPNEYINSKNTTFYVQLLQPYWRVLNKTLPSIGTPNEFANNIITFIDWIKTNFHKNKKNLENIYFGHKLSIFNNIFNITENKLYLYKIKSDKYIKYNIPYKLYNDKIIIDTDIKKDIFGILLLLNTKYEILDKINNIREDDNLYAFLSLYLYNIIQLYIDLNIDYISSYNINKELLNKYELSLNKLKVLINNNYYHQFKPNLDDTKRSYNLKLDRGVFNVVLPVGRNINIYSYKPFDIITLTNFIFGSYKSIYDINTNEPLDIGMCNLYSTNKSLISFNNSVKLDIPIYDTTNISTFIKNRSVFFNNLKDLFLNGISEFDKNYIDNISSYNILFKKYKDYLLNSSNYLKLLIINKNKNIDVNIELTNKLYANYYYFISEYYKIKSNQLSTNISKTTYDISIYDNEIFSSMKSLFPKKININKNTVKSSNIKNNLTKLNKNKNVKNNLTKLNKNKKINIYNDNTLWNNLNNIIRNRNIYIPISKNNKIYLFNILGACINNTNKDELILPFDLYNINVFKKNLILVSLRTDNLKNNNFRYFTFTTFNKLVKSNQSNIRKLFYNIITNKDIYIDSTEPFKNTDNFILKLSNLDKELYPTHKTIYENTQQVLTLEQLNNMILKIK